MNTIIFLTIYLAFGFVFMTLCARKGWMDKYDPALMYWIAWPVIIFVACFRLFADSVSSMSATLDNYVNSLKPKQDEN